MEIVNLSKINTNVSEFEKLLIMYGNTVTNNEIMYIMVLYVDDLLN